jgi:hypothetical protein
LRIASNTQSRDAKLALSEFIQGQPENNYRGCVKRGSEEEAKPKRKQRKTRDEDDE